MQCKGKVSCKYCGENHDQEACELKNNPNCIMCGGEHNAMERNKCDEYNNQKSIKETMVVENISYNEAKEKHKNSYATVAKNKVVGSRYTVTKKSKPNEYIPRKNVLSEERREILEIPNVASHTAYELFRNVPSDQNMLKNENHKISFVNEILNIINSFLEKKISK